MRAVRAVTLHLILVNAYGWAVDDQNVLSGKGGSGIQ